MNRNHALQVGYFFFYSLSGVRFVWRIFVFDVVLFVLYIVSCEQIFKRTLVHSSRKRTARAIIVFPDSLSPGRGRRVSALRCRPPPPPDADSRSDADPQMQTPPPEGRPPPQKADPPDRRVSDTRL